MSRFVNTVKAPRRGILLDCEIFADGSRHYLNEGPDVVDEGAGEQHVDDDQHDEAEDVQGQAAELLVLHNIVFRNNQYIIIIIIRQNLQGAAGGQAELLD